MTDKKLTDNEIIKALESLANGCFDCNDGCKEDLECPVEVIRATLDLINRLQVENENLKMVLDAVEDHINPLPFETDYAKAIRQAKAEAYKEFAEMLIDKAKNGVIQICDLPDYVIEMVGEDNGQSID